MAGRRFGTNLDVVGETGSTNDDLKRAAGAGAPDGTVLLAEQQTAGRGRLGREWASVPGRSVLMSALLAPGPALAEGQLVPLAAGVAVADAVADAGVEARLKWPNDVLTSTGKLAGILVEGEVAGPGFAWVVVGIGLNANHAAEGLPPGATSLALERGAPQDRGALVVALLHRLEERLEHLGSGALLDDYRRRCATLGQMVRVERRSGILEGTAVDVDDTGALLVDTGAGIERVTQGDVVHLRLAGA